MIRIGPDTGLDELRRGWKKGMVEELTAVRGKVNAEFSSNESFPDERGPVRFSFKFPSIFKGKNFCGSCQLKTEPFSREFKMRIRLIRQIQPFEESRRSPVIFVFSKQPLCCRAFLKGRVLSRIFWDKSKGVR